MHINEINQQQLLNTLVTAIQTCIYNYPTYNYLTQHQNALRLKLVEKTNNPLLKSGQKYFSQNDEDGILLEILKRINLKKSKDKPSFIEFGVENGLECNSLILLMNYWKGIWVGNEDLAFDLNESKNLHYKKGWVTLENCAAIYAEGLKKINESEYDLLSMDLDGNDLHFIKSILEEKYKPKIIIAEYNAKFPPPIKFSVTYDAEHNFKDDYMGASLQSLCDLLIPNGYFLACCNITGSNSFFVSSEYKNAFTDIPSSINQLFMPPNYGIVTRVGHPVSPKTILNFI
jgi:hypothetical protein